MLMRIIENFERSWLQLLCNLIVVSRHTQEIGLYRISLHTFCLIASSIGVIEEVMVEYGLLDADATNRRNIRLLPKMVSLTGSSVYLGLTLVSVLPT